MSTKPDIDKMIRQTDALIAQATKIDPIVTTLLGLAKAELTTCKAVKTGEIVRFARPASRAH